MIEVAVIGTTLVLPVETVIEDTVTKVTIWLKWLCDWYDCVTEVTKVADWSNSVTEVATGVTVTTDRVDHVTEVLRDQSNTVTE